MVTARSSALHASSARRMATAMPHGFDVVATADGGGTLLADLGASERGCGALDGLDDVEERDVGRRAPETEAALAAGHRFDDASPGEQLQLLAQVRGRHVVELGEPSSGQGLVRRERSQQGEAMDAPLDAVAHLHNLDNIYPDIRCPGKSRIVDLDRVRLL